MFYYEIALVGTPLAPLTYVSEEALEAFTQVRVKLQNRQVMGCIIAEVDTPEFKTLPIEAVENYSYAPHMDTACFVSEYYGCSLGEALALFVPFKTPSVFISPSSNDNDTFIQLSEEQTSAYTFLQQHPVALLFGDTGSGKTEIYMRYFQEVLSDSQQALFLMPEISLTPQMQKRLEVHFGDGVVMWHSKLTKKQKERALESIYSGQARVIAGPRSALFLPLERLGLIVVDEEHDESYKSASRPRYHARDMAIYISTQKKIPVVLGSATPSLTTYVKFPHYRLKGGYFDSRRHFVYEAGVEGMTPLIDQAIDAMQKRSGQGIIFIPTRANFKYLICESCGFTFECPYCSVGMSVHRNHGALKCHYCNFSEPIPRQCPKCSHGELVSSRIGTAEALQTLQERFPNLTIEQFDRDTITTHRKLKEALKRFNDGETQLLVGTQMLSKGHDYHDVTLAVVLGLDNLLNQSDYRARERALSTLIQIAGRSGRKKEATVVVQSFNEAFFSAYVDAYETFLEEEKLFREGMYPPYKKLCRLLFADKNAQKASSAMEESLIRLQRFPEVEVVGSGASAIERIAGKYRYQILLRADKSTDLIRACKGSITAMAEIDMDPVEFH